MVVEPVSKKGIKNSATVKRERERAVVSLLLIRIHFIFLVSLILSDYYSPSSSSSYSPSSFPTLVWRQNALSAMGNWCISTSAFPPTHELCDEAAECEQCIPEWGKEVVDEEEEEEEGEEVCCFEHPLGQIFTSHRFSLFLCSLVHEEEASLMVCFQRCRCLCRETLALSGARIRENWRWDASSAVILKSFGSRTWKRGGHDLLAIFKLQMIDGETCKVWTWKSFCTLFPQTNQPTSRPFQIKRIGIGIKVGIGVGSENENENGNGNNIENEEERAGQTIQDLHQVQYTCAILAFW